MLSIGKWLEKNGEAIYGTRICAPYSTPTVDYTQSKDGKTVYAIVKDPAKEIVLEGVLGDQTEFSVLGDDKSLSFTSSNRGAVVNIPADYASEYLPFVVKCRRSGI